MTRFGCLELTMQVLPLKLEWSKSFVSKALSRYDLGREKFLEKVWEWKELYANTIREQWAKMGLSLDYSRERFTLDEGLSQAVREVFVKSL